MNLVTHSAQNKQLLDLPSISLHLQSHAHVTLARARSSSEASGSCVLLLCKQQYLYTVSCGNSYINHPIQHSSYRDFYTCEFIYFITKHLSKTSKLIYWNRTLQSSTSSPVQIKWHMLMFQKMVWIYTVSTFRCSRLVSKGRTILQ